MFRSRLSLTRLCLALVLSLAALAAQGCASAPATAPVRGDALIDRGWAFARRDVAGAESPDLDDAAWARVDLPHTWNALDGQDGGDDYYRGPGWYRRHLTVPAADAGRRLFLRFEGAALVTRAYVNGRPAGTHRGGFAAFCFDVTDLLRVGDNLIAVRVDNAADPNIPPLSGDFTICGGLYRDVRLLALDPVHVSPTDDASPGVYLAGQNVSAASADVQATIVLRNDTDAAQPVAARVSILDAAGKPVASGEVRQTLPARGGAEPRITLRVDRPHLWNGKADPYLYRAAVDLRRGGKTVDRVVQPLGLRSFAFDARRGFALNGRPYAVRGVGVHQDYYDKGWAIGPEQIDENYRLIGEMGATAVRLAHYQHPEYEYALCDRQGYLVWAETPLVNRVGDSPEFDENAKQQLRELIKQNYNHPSVVLWSLFNELGPHTRTDWHLVHDENDLAHALDPTRPTVAAYHGQADYPLPFVPDVSAFNRYYGWYTLTKADWPAELDKMHALAPDSAIGISEYGAGGSVAAHENSPTTRPKLAGAYHPEEWQNEVHEAAWAAMRERPWLWGTFAWAMFDFAADARAEGDHPGRNDKGLVTIDRKTRKDAFYLYKANWTADPFVYLTSRRYTPRPGGEAPVKVYSNCDEVELFLDGVSQGVRRNADHVFVWPDVVLPEGQCAARAVGRRDGRTVEDACTWLVTAPPPAPSQPATGSSAPPPLTAPATGPASPNPFSTKNTPVD